MTGRAAPAAHPASPAVRRLRRIGLVLMPWTLIVLAWYAVRASGLVNPALVPARGRTCAADDPKAAERRKHGDAEKPVVSGA